MLTSLCIENFAIVTRLELDFSKGMTAFTGETGAGKSIMIDALMLALGARSDASVVRQGMEKCDISACFIIDKDSEPLKWLLEHDIDANDGLVVLRRIIYSEGRSKSTINGHPFPLTSIKELSEMLVHIHGQHQHQTLMQHATHRQQLDAYAHHETVLLNLSRLYKEIQHIQKQIDDIKGRDNQADKTELLAFQIAELEHLNIQADEIQSLNHEHQMLHHAVSYLNHLQHIHQLLRAEDGPDVCQNLHHILSILKDLPSHEKQIQNAADLINNALIQCEEALSELDDFADKVQLDPERLQEVELRMAAIHQMARKYHIKADDLPQHLEQLAQELKQIKEADTILVRLDKALIDAKKIYEQEALKLRETRLIAAKKLSAEITASIQKLGMPKGQVLVNVAPLDKPQMHGMDKVEYLVQTNPGMPFDSLTKIASGGELSRISLAIQMITAQCGSTPTLFFDEVDVGIGGATAALVGQMLRTLGERLQVFCVTHQPQVAAAAHHHYVVSKHSDDLQTWSSISAVADFDKVDEIARMLGGLTITEQTRTHAEELIKQSV